MLKLLLLLLIVHEIIAQEGSYCRTPLRDHGRCVNIGNCDPLISLLKTQAQNREVRYYLMQSNCGYFGTVPLVCCPQLERNPEPVTIPSTTSTSPTTPTTTTTTEGQSDQFQGRSSTTLPDYPNCGKSNASDFRVVGGTPASLGQFPWIVALGYRNSKNPEQPRWLCGGTLITDRHVLTAAHCVKGREDLYLARLGELDLYSDTEGANPVDIAIVDRVIHSAFNTRNYTYDIAILTLANKVEHPSIMPACLPKATNLRSQTFERYHGYVAGWGSIYFNGPRSNVLQFASLPIVSTETCKKAFSDVKQAVIDDKVLCAGYPDGGKDSCKGDSGGPFMLGRQQDGNFVYYLMGVVSYGIKCAEPGYYGVYSRTSSFMDWIETNLH